MFFRWCEFLDCRGTNLGNFGSSQHRQVFPGAEKTNSYVIQVVTFWYPSWRSLDLWKGHGSLSPKKGTNRITNSMVHPNIFCLDPGVEENSPFKCVGNLGMICSIFSSFCGFFEIQTLRVTTMDVIAFIFKLVDCSNVAAACQHVMPGNFLPWRSGQIIATKPPRSP